MGVGCGRTAVDRRAPASALQRLPPAAGEHTYAHRHQAVVQRGQRLGPSGGDVRYRRRRAAARRVAPSRRLLPCRANSQYRPVRDSGGPDLAAPEQPVGSLPRPPEEVPQQWAHTGRRHTGRLRCDARLELVRGQHPSGVAAVHQRRVRCLPRMRHPGAPLREAALRELRPRQAAGLQLQVPGLLPLMRCAADVADRGAPGSLPHVPVRQRVLSLPIPAPVLGFAEGV